MKIYNLNYNHPFKPIWAAVPGWGLWGSSGGAGDGRFMSIGLDRRIYESQEGGVTGAASLPITTYKDGTPVKVARAENGTYRFVNTDNDLFIERSEFTLVGIFKPKGNGSFNDAGDPRIFTKDLGSGADDHDLMIGGVRALPNCEFRARVRVGTSTRTVITSGFNIQQDAWNAIAVTVGQSASGVALSKVHGLREDGLYNFNTDSVAGSYAPRTTTDLALFATAADGSNQFEGDILYIAMFDGAFQEGDIRRLFDDPWQIFAPKQFYVPMFPYDPNAVIEVEAPAGDTLTITLVDASGNPLTNLTGITWAWFDESVVNSATTPTATGTGATTDGSGVFSVDITGTTLTSGQTGMLALQDSTGYIYALYRITLT